MADIAEKQIRKAAKGKGKPRGKPFPKGKSGNPKGRPRKEVCITSLLKERLGEPAPVKNNDGTSKTWAEEPRIGALIAEEDE